MKKKETKTQEDAKYLSQEELDKILEEAEAQKTVNIIALTGLARTGKDTIAEYLVSNHNYTRYAFADPIKRFISSVFGIPIELLDRLKEDLKGKFKYISPINSLCTGKNMRKIFQGVGDAFKAILGDNNVFIKLLIKEVRKDAKKYVVISDLRYLNEYSLIQEEFGKIIVIQIKKDDVLPTDEHSSEVEYLDIPSDIIITNNGTKEELYNTVNSFLRSYKDTSTVLKEE